ncbi:hypothetical protein GE09DRAFT_1098054 [Coniochaeta sp. 2T2.1]|nr:hypothetical protein GE09DRAFT_1098054 [Coniochaeta sp. 2T2.1]
MHTLPQCRMDRCNKPGTNVNTMADRCYFAMAVYKMEGCCFLKAVLAASAFHTSFTETLTTAITMSGKRRSRTPASSSERGYESIIPYAPACPESSSSSTTYERLREKYDHAPRLLLPSPFGHASRDDAPPVESIQSFSPFPDSFYDVKDDRSKPWYECIEVDKLCLLGLFAMFAYDGDDAGHSVAASLLEGRHHDPDADSAILMKGNLHSLKSELCQARILDMNENGDWLFNGSAGHSAKDLKANIIDGIIDRKDNMAQEVFQEATSRLQKYLEAHNTFSMQTYDFIRQLCRVHGQIGERERQKEPEREHKKETTPYILPLELRNDFVELLYEAMWKLDRRDSRYPVLERMIAEVERRVAELKTLSTMHGLEVAVEGLSVDARR